jgi:flagellar biosynthesis protein FlhF
MAEALQQVKRQFGPHAVILSTKTVTRGGLLGVGARSCVEITAAATMPDLPSPSPCRTLESRKGTTERAEGAANPVSARPQSTEGRESTSLLSEVTSLKFLIGDLVRETRRGRAERLPDELYETYQTLVGNAVAEELAEQIVAAAKQDLEPARLRDPDAVRRYLANAIEARLPAAGPIELTNTDRPTVIALVGPTGVGKTTTVAKLAANLCLREHRAVGLITIDTYRIAAVDQLRTYAEIIDVPLRVVNSPEDLKDALADMNDRDVVLIDTAGRSQRDRLRIEELGRFFDLVRPDELHLVLAGTCGQAVLRQTIDRFRELGFDRVIFTKLDEAVGFGLMLTCLERAGAKLSYVTTGQDVPDDLHVGEARALARLILGETAQSRATGSLATTANSRSRTDDSAPRSP